MTIPSKTRFSAFSRAAALLALSVVLWASAPAGSSRAEPPNTAGESPAVAATEADSPSPAPTSENAPSAPVHTVPVHFTAKRGTLQVEAVGPTPNRCTTPCTLLLVPGKTELLVSGDGRFSQSIAIPDQETAVELSTRRRGRTIVGGVLTIIGLVASGVGIATATMDTSLGATVGLCVTGLVGTIGGFVLMRRAGHNGARIVESERQVAQSDARNVSFAGVGVAPMLSHAGAQVSTRFRF